MDSNTPNTDSPRFGGQVSRQRSRLNSLQGSPLGYFKKKFKRFQASLKSLVNTRNEMKPSRSYKRIEVNEAASVPRPMKNLESSRTIETQVKTQQSTPKEDQDSQSKHTVKEKVMQFERSFVFRKPYSMSERSIVSKWQEETEIVKAPAFGEVICESLLAVNDVRKKFGESCDKVPRRRKGKATPLGEVITEPLPKVSDTAKMFEDIKDQIGIVNVQPA